MDNYQIGKDVNDINNRLSKLESAFMELLDHIQSERSGKSEEKPTR